MSSPDSGPEGFEAWFRESAEELLRLSYLCTRDKGLAENISQDVAVKVFKAWADEGIREEILTQPGYVRTMVRNAFRDYLKVPSRTRQGEVELDPERHSRPGAELVNDLRLAVLSLEGDEFRMIDLHYYEDLTIGDAGERMGLPASQAYRLHTRALAHLAKLMTETDK